MSCNCNKSTLQAFSSTPQTVASGEVIEFANASVHTGCAIRYTAGSGSITLVQPGIYKISVTASGGNGAGLATIQLYRNGTPMPCCQAQATTATDETVNMSFPGLVKVARSCCAVDNTTILTLVNAGIGETYSHVSIVVEKID